MHVLVKKFGGVLVAVTVPEKPFLQVQPAITEEPKLLTGHATAAKSVHYYQRTNECRCCCIPEESEQQDQSSLLGIGKTAAVLSTVQGKVPLQLLAAEVNIDRKLTRASALEKGRGRGGIHLPDKPWRASASRGNTETSAVGGAGHRCE